MTVEKAILWRNSALDGFAVALALDLTVTHPKALKQIITAQIGIKEDSASIY